MSEPMAAGHEEYAEWDGAYVLGALSAADRAEFERHLAACEACQAAVAELAALPGLLGRTNPAESLDLLGEETTAELAAMPRDLEQRILAAAEAESLPRPDAQRDPLPEPQAGSGLPWAAGLDDLSRSHSPGGAGAMRARRRWARIGAGVVAAAAVVAIAVAVPVLTRDDRPTGEQVSLRAVGTSPLSADVTLQSVAWGTRIEMTCTYADTPGGGPAGWSRSYGLYVIDPDGAAHVVSTWRAAPGGVAHTSGSTDLAVADVRGLQIRASDGTTVLLSAEVG